MVALSIRSLVSAISLFASSQAALTRVNNFGTNPSGIQMFIDVPTNVAANAPIILAVGPPVYPRRVLVLT